MIQYFDKNLSWAQPENSVVESVTPDGAYLQIRYRSQDQLITTVYLNDMGREVGRSLVLPELPKPEPVKPLPPKKRFRVKNAFLLLLEDLEALLKCLK